MRHSAPLLALALLAVLSNQPATTPGPPRPAFKTKNQRKAERKKEKNRGTR